MSPLKLCLSELPCYGDSLHPSLNISKNVVVGSVLLFSYRRLLRIGERHEDTIDEVSIIAQELIERHPDIPTFHRVMVDGLPYMVVGQGNGGRVKKEGMSDESEEINHYELWIMTKLEIERELEKECLFVPPPLFTGYVSISVCNILFRLAN